MHDPIVIAAAEIAAGRLVAFPTETVYGLGADASNPDAVARIYAIKGRPTFNPLIAHVASVDAARREGLFNRDTERLAERFWPGPLTLVLPRAAAGTICELACAGLSSVGLRIPDHRLALELLAQVARPVAAPSANRSGRLSPTTASDVTSDLGVDFGRVLDGGPCRIGLESTIIGLSGDGPVLLRPGGIPHETIAETIGRPLASPGPSVLAPGMLTSHYAPNARLRLDAIEIRADETGLDFAGTLGSDSARDLSRSGDLVEAAANLFRDLRALDAMGATTIAVAPIPSVGLGLAIVDRLRRAAAPR